MRNTLPLPALFLAALSLQGSFLEDCDSGERLNPLPLGSLTESKDQKVRDLTQGAMGWSLAYGTKDNVATVSGGWARAPFEEDYPSVPLTHSKRIQLASVSKPITATALMTLVDQGLVDVDHPFVDYIGPGFEVRGAGVNTVTVRDLLTHRTGMVHTDDCGPVFRTKMKALIAKDLVEPPHGESKYANANACLTRLVIEGVAKRSYPGYVIDRVFLPMGITDMSCKPDDNDPTLAYSKNQKSGKGLFFYQDYTEECAAYGWWGSTHDLFKFAEGVRSSKVMSAATTKKMLDENLGWGHYQTAQGRAYHHNGGFGAGDQALGTIVFIFPNGVNATFVVNSNEFDSWDIARQVYETP